jgi:hypothetical protein
MPVNRKWNMVTCSYFYNWFPHIMGDFSISPAQKAMLNSAQHQLQGAILQWPSSTLARKVDEMSL